MSGYQIDRRGRPPDEPDPSVLVVMVVVALAVMTLLHRWVTQ